MLILSSTSDLIQLVTSAAVTVDVHASWADLLSEAVTPGRTLTAITTAATTTVVGSPGGSTQRTVTQLFVKNKHASSSNTVTVQHYDGATTVEMMKVTLAAGEALVYSENAWFVYDASGAVKSIASMSAYAVDPKTNDFRLSGVSGTPVMSADSTTLSTLYLAQFVGNRIALYDGNNWQLCTPASEVSLAVTGRTTDLPCDVFAYNASGTVTLELLDWTSATARATALVRQDGVWCKSGALTRRYLGSVRPRSATTFHWVLAGSDAPAKMDLWNTDNRVDVGFKNIATTDTWTYTTATIRQAQGSANYQIEIMVGLQEESIDLELQAASKNSTISIARNVGIGIDSTTVMSGIFVGTSNTVASIECAQTARLCHQPTIGRHYYAWLEISTATGTCTWMGDNGALRLQSGMTGVWTC